MSSKRDPSKLKTLDSFLEEEGIGAEVDRAAQAALDDDAPPLSREWFKGAKLYDGDKRLR